MDFKDTFDTLKDKATNSVLLVFLHSSLHGLGRLLHHLGDGFDLRLHLGLGVAKP